MRKQRTLVLMLALAIAMAGTALTYAGGRSFRSGGMPQGDGLNLCDSLTEEQRTALHEMVTEMKEAGDAREAIRAAVGEKLKEFGIEVPEDRGQRPRRGDGPFANLSEDQRAEIRTKVTEMKEAGASREEIRASVGAMLEGWGVELPERTGDRPKLRRPGLRLLCASLTEDQRAEIRTKVTEMKEAGASREEIRAGVGAMLEGWGVELPERTGERPKLRRPGLRLLCANLSEDQRAEIKAKVMEMKEAGATPEEIRAGVDAMLEGYGIELPEAASEEIVPDVTPSARIAATTAVQSASWGQIKSRMK